MPMSLFDFNVWKWSKVLRNENEILSPTHCTRIEQNSDVKIRHFSRGNTALFYNSKWLIFLESEKKEKEREKERPKTKMNLCVRVCMNA